MDKMSVLTRQKTGQTLSGKNGAGDHRKPEFIDHPIPGLNA